MTKTYKKVEAPDGTRHMVRLEDVRCEPEQMRARQLEFLKTVAADGAYSGLLVCGVELFHRLAMSFQDHTWVIEMEYLESKDA